MKTTATSSNTMLWAAGFMLLVAGAIGSCSGQLLAACVAALFAVYPLYACRNWRRLAAALVLLLAVGVVAASVDDFQREMEGYRLRAHTGQPAAGR